MVVLTIEFARVPRYSFFFTKHMRDFQKEHKKSPKKPTRLFTSMLDRSSSYMVIPEGTIRRAIFGPLTPCTLYVVVVVDGVVDWAVVGALNSPPFVVWWIHQIHAQKEHTHTHKHEKPKKRE